MNKYVKRLCFAIIVIIILALIFFTVDYKRVANNKLPIFCIKIGVIRDGSSIEYLGLGYRVIKYNTLDGYNEIKIGTLFMKYHVPLDPTSNNSFMATITRN